MGLHGRRTRLHGLMSALILLPALGVPLAASASGAEREAQGQWPVPCTDPVNPSDMTDSQLALELACPASQMWRIENRLEYRSHQGSLPGAGDGESWMYEFSSAYPIQLDNGKLLELRATVPIYFNQHIWEVYYDDPIWELDRSYADWLLRQSPQVTPSTGRFETGHDHMADVSIDVAYGGVNSDGLIAMFGLASVWPVSTDISASRDQYLLGPQLVLGKTSERFVGGARIKHLTDVGGDKRFSTNETWIDLFFAYPLGNGWQLVSNPSVLYDWEADSGNRLLFPLGGGVSRTMRIGGVPTRINAELYYYAETAERMGTEWMFRLNLAPAFRPPWPKN